MSDFIEESMIREKMKRRMHYESEDRLSDLPDSILLHILSFLKTEHVFRTCVLSTRWKHLWKHIPTLILHYWSSSSMEKEKHKQFFIFVSKILTLRDNSSALHSFDFRCNRIIEPQLLQKILNYVCSHNTQLQQLKIAIRGECGVMPCVSSCQALTSLQLSILPRDLRYPVDTTLFPKSLSLPALTSLGLRNFTFCGGENGCAEPFLAFTKLKSLLIRGCEVRDAQIRRISSETLGNLNLCHNSFDSANIELDAPSLCTFTYFGSCYSKICGSGLSSVKQVNIGAKMYIHSEKPPMVLLSWLLDLASVRSLKVSSTTLQILSLVPDLLEVKFPSLCNLKSMEIELEPVRNDMELFHLMKEAMLKKAAAKSRKEANKLRKAFKAGLKPPSIPDGIVDFLLQNSPSAKVTSQQTSNQ